MASCSFRKFNYIENQLQNITRVEVIRSSECMQIFMEENKHGNNGNLFITFVFTGHFHEHRNLIFTVQCSVSAPTRDPQPPK